MYEFSSELHALHATARLIGGILVLHQSASNGMATTLFNETFEGYTSFLENPTGYNPPDMVNPGVAEISEGASEFWYGIRFQGSGSIDADLAIQRYGGGANETHTGRVSHDSGMVLRIDTTDMRTSTFHLTGFVQAESPTSSLLATISVTIWKLWRMSKFLNLTSGGA